MVRLMSDAPPLAAGFFVTKASARDAERSPDLLPGVLTSLSPCIAPSYQVSWAWDVEKEGSEAVAFGIAEPRLPELQDWERSHGISFPNVFHSLDDARAYWFAGVPEGTPLDVGALRNAASSYRAVAYTDLTELRSTADDTQRILRATDRSGQSWSISIYDSDVPTVQSALDVVDG